MKEKRNMYRFVTVIVSFIVAVMLLVAAIPAYAEAEATIKEMYMVGDTVNIPSKTVNVDGENVKAITLIEQPSGALLRVEESFIIKQEGLHKLVYKAVNSKGAVYQESVEFLACSKLYGMQTTLSQLSYGNPAYGDYVIDREAILASIASTDKFTYSEIINLNELNGESFLEFFVTPEVIGTPDANKIEIVLTDVHDPSNFVTIAIKKGTAGQAGAAWAEKNSYITGNAAFQNPTGLETNKGTLVIDGVNYQLHNANVWGANVSFALPGNPNYVSLENPNNTPEGVGTQTLALSMDTTNQAIYANGQLVTILSSEDIYKDGTWSGFTTGECFLSISATNYNASALNLAITKLGNNAINSENVESAEKLKKNIFVDTVAPTVSLQNAESFANGYPNAIAGIKYKLFPVKVSDDYTASPVTYTEVYYAYGTGNQVRVDLVNGMFTPFVEGKYTIVYYAVDKYGNMGKLEIEVYALPKGTPSLSATAPTLSNATIGTDYTLPAPTITNITGSAEWKAEAVHQTNGKVYTISSDNPTFFPEYAGKYEVTYYVDDYITSITVSTTLTAIDNDVPVFFEDPVLPEYFIKGCEYQLPEILAKIYATGEPVETLPEIYIIEDGKSEMSSGYRFISYANESVQIIYRLEVNGKKTEYVSKVIPVIDVGYNGTYTIDKYFVKNGLTSTPEGKYIRFAVNADFGEKVYTSFINRLQTFDFSLKLAATGFGMDTINIILTDYADPTVQLKFTYRYESGQVFFSVNDGVESVLENVSFDDSESPLNLALSDNGCTVMPTGSSVLSVKVTNDLSGKEFNGFNESMAYLTVELENITNYKQAGIDIFNLSGQPISGIYVDNIKPKISAVGQSGARPFGSQFTIPSVYISDVLDPSVTIKMSVTAPDGSYVTALDGTILNEKNAKYYTDYTINLDQYGSYSVNYTVTDISGNKLPFTYVITSSDMTPPEIILKDHSTEGKVGEAIYVADIEIVDNNDKNAENFVVYVSIVTPQGQSFAMLDKTGERTNYFTAKTAGTYTVNYLVIDSSGNLTLESYEIIVK